MIEHRWSFVWGRGGFGSQAKGFVGRGRLVAVLLIALQIGPERAAIQRSSAIPSEQTHPAVPKPCRVIADASTARPSFDGDRES